MLDLQNRESGEAFTGSLTPEQQTGYFSLLQELLSIQQEAEQLVVKVPARSTS